MAFFKKDLQKNFMAITVKLIELVNNGKAINDEVLIEWKRGP